jgi:hypothetical protein
VLTIFSLLSGDYLWLCASYTVQRATGKLRRLAVS